VPAVCRDCARFLKLRHLGSDPKCRSEESALAGGHSVQSVRVDGDEIWKPGYAGPPPVVPGSEPAVVTDHVTAPKRRRRGGLVLGCAICCGLVIVTYWATRSSPRSDRSEPALSNVVAVSSAGLTDVVATSGQAFAGADERRIPGAVDPLWRRPMDAADDIWVEAVGRQHLVVARGSEAPGTDVGQTTIDVLDASSGMTRWSLDLDVRLRSVAFVASFDDVLVFHIGDTVHAFDAANGVDRWQYRIASEPFACDIERLEGTDLLVLAVNADYATLVDGRSGEEVGDLDGPRIATDYVGNWFVERNNDIVKYNLRNGFTAPTIVASGVGADVVSVVDGQPVASGEFGWRTARSGDEWVPEIRPATDESGELPNPAASITAMTGRSFLVAGSGEVFGVEVDESTLRVAWRRTGIISSTHPTERGIVAVVANDGGAEQTIIDGRTGAPITDLTMSPGAFEALEIVGNGFVAARTSSDGPRLAGHDLDGAEVWSIPGVTKAAVGDRIVVYPERVGDEFVIVAVGEVA
jgi:PQQ-like domain